MLVIAALLATTSAAAAPPINAWTIDVPIILTASAPSSNVETTLLPWVSIRAGRIDAFDASDGAADDDTGAAYGFDASLLGSWARDGTDEVAATRGLLAVNGRGLIVPVRYSTTYSALVPYGYAGVVVGGGFVDIQAFKDSQVEPLLTWGASVGVGARAAIHGVTTTIELGVGMRDLRFELSSSLALGYTF